MSNAISSFGTLLKIGDGGSPAENFTTIAEVTDIGGPEFTLATEDVTNHSSIEGWREYIGTILDPGEIQFSINFIPTEATHNPSTGLIKDMVDKTLRNFELVFPDSGSTTWSFSALITSFKSSEPVQGKLAADVTLRVSGKPTLS